MPPMTTFIPFSEKTVGYFVCMGYFGGKAVSVIPTRSAFWLKSIALTLVSEYLDVPVLRRKGREGGKGKPYESGLAALREAAEVASVSSGEDEKEFLLVEAFISSAFSCATRLIFHKQKPRSVSFVRQDVFRGAGVLWEGRFS